MTHDSGASSRRAGRDEGKPRLQLKPHAAPAAYLDGVWWPRSTHLATELLDLVQKLSDRLGDVAVVGYHRSAWTHVPPQMQIDGESVQLEGFTSDEPATVLLIGRDGRRVSLQVISPGANEVVARQKMDAASHDLGVAGSVSNRAEQLAGRSTTEVAAQLDNHEGRADPERTAQITRWCEEAAQQFVDAPIQAFVPILIHHIVRSRMRTPRPAI